MVGLLVGASVAGQLADTFGRKGVLYSFLFFLSAFGTGCSFAPVWEVYAALRFFVGVCIGGEFLVIPVLL